MEKTYNEVIEGAIFAIKKERLESLNTARFPEGNYIVSICTYGCVST